MMIWKTVITKIVAAAASCRNFYKSVLFFFLIALIVTYTVPLELQNKNLYGS